MLDIFSGFSNAFSFVDNIKSYFTQFLGDIISLWELLPSGLQVLISVCLSIMIICGIMRTLKSVIPFI